MKSTNLSQTAAWVDVRELLEQHHALHVHYRRDELICQAGTYAAGIHLVVSGIVQESYSEPENGFGDAVLLLGGPGQLIGTELLLPDPEDLHRTTFRAVSDVRLCFLEQSAFHRALETSDLLWRFLLGCLSKTGFERARAQWRCDLPGRERLTLLLLDLSPLAGSPQSDGETTLPQEVDLRTLAGLLRLSARQTRRLCAELPDVRWSQGCLSFFPERLAEQLTEPSAPSHELRSGRS